MYFSIIIPVYNTEKYLKNCVQSVLCQSFTDFEIILVNDGSTDNSGIVCDKLKSSDCRIKVIHKKNGGVSSARNMGISIAKGKYIGFVDSDDTLEKDCFKIIFDKSNEINADIISFGINDIKDGKIINISSVKDFYCTNMLQFKPHFYEYNNKIIGSVCMKFFKASLIKSNNITFNENLHINEDAMFDYDAISVAKSILNFSQPFYNYIQYDNSSSHKGRKDVLDAAIIRHNRYLEFVKQLGFENDADIPKINYIQNGVYAQYLQAVISTNNFEYKDRIEILRKLYKNKEYKNFILEKIENQPKSLSLLLGKLSVKLNAPFLVAIPSIIKSKLHN